MIAIRSPQQLGDALRAARKQLGLTQSQLALAAGVGVRFIVELEAGKPTLRTTDTAFARPCHLQRTDRQSRCACEEFLAIVLR